MLLGAPESFQWEVVLNLPQAARNPHRPPTISSLRLPKTRPGAARRHFRVRQKPSQGPPRTLSVRRLKGAAKQRGRQDAY
eukprot:1938592-Pyramimonas_sp.AAC.1